MTYATLLVHMEIGQSNAGLLQVAATLAERCGAGVIGIAGCQPMMLVASEGGDVYGDLIERDRQDIGRELRVLETAFWVALRPRVPLLEWRSEVLFGPLADYVATSARDADLVISGIGSGPLPNGTARLSTGDMIMQLGRPSLIVPAGHATFPLESVVVGWRDGRETRRAVRDALPLMRLARQVTIVEIAPEDDLAAARERLGKVEAWLRRHGVAAASLVAPSTGDDADRLQAVAQELNADVIVAGAYGHSRLREWAFGGVTRDLLRPVDRCSFLSH